MLQSYFYNISRLSHTMEPRFNKVPRDWGNLFVISRVCYIENLDIMNLWKNNQNVCYIEA